MKLFFPALFIIASLFVVPSFSQQAYVKEVREWRTAHEKEFTADDGWLTLAGLFWLKEGVNTIGYGGGFDVELPKTAGKGKFGEIAYKNGMGVLKLENGVAATSGGKPFTSGTLESDENQKQTIIQSGSVSFFLIKRGEKTGVRIRDKENPGRTAFTGMKWFPINKAFKVTADFEAFSEPKEILVPNMLGGEFKMKSPGILKFKLFGKQYSLQPVTEDDKLFIIFRDLTSRKKTYPVGRFLYAAWPVNGKVILDFNKAENPPCAFTTFATCPIPPQQNRLKIAIPAGEKKYGH